MTLATRLTAQITAADIAAPGNVAVSVNDPVNGTSNSLSFTIQPAVLGLNSVSPASVAVGGPSFMLTVLGTGFTNASVVQWNGGARTTTFVTTYELVAQIAAADIAAIGTASVTVHDATQRGWDDRSADGHDRAGVEGCRRLPRSTPRIPGW